MVTLAILVAVFRDPLLSCNLSSESLSSLILRASHCLLDERLAPTNGASSTLDSSTSTQLVRAINKLAIHAATSTSRHVAIQALLTLQLKFCDENSLLSTKLSKVISKLFNKVLKDESVSPNPYASVDLESILCLLDDTLVSCNRNTLSNNSSSASPVEDMILTLLKSLVSSRTQKQILETMIDVGIDPDESCLGNFMSSRNLVPLTKTQSNEDVNDARIIELASIISQISSETNETEREYSIGSLQRFKQLHPDIDINSHLSQVSGHFRTFILEKLETSEVDPLTSQKCSTKIEEKIIR